MLDYSVATPAPPAEEPVTLSEAKKQANVVASDDDAYVSALIVAARELLERDTNRALVTRTMRLRLHQFPGERYIRLPKPPLDRVTEIAYVDTSGVDRVLSAAEYSVDTDREPGVIWLAPGGSWPATRADQVNAVEIAFVAGYGGRSSVPQRAKHAILLLVAYWYQNRETVGMVANELEFTYSALVQSLRIGCYP